MNNEEAEQCLVIPGEETGGFLGGEEEEGGGNKRKHAGGEVGDTAVGGDKKRKSVGISGNSQGILAVKADGKKYYQCRMSDCVKVRYF